MLADPDTGCTSITSSGATTQRAQFAERDGRTCALTSLEEELCDAMHLLAHSKGDTVCCSH